MDGVRFCGNLEQSLDAYSWLDVGTWNSGLKSFKDFPVEYWTTDSPNVLYLLGCKYVKRVDV
jgi:hypothetical protein